MHGTTQLEYITNIRESAMKVLLRQKGRGNLSLHFCFNFILPKISAPLYYNASYARSIGAKTLLQAELISVQNKCLLTPQFKDGNQALILEYLNEFFSN